MHRLTAFLLAMIATLLFACTSSSQPMTLATEDDNSAAVVTTLPKEEIDTVDTAETTVENVAEDVATADEPVADGPIQPVLVATKDTPAVSAEESIDWLTEATTDGSFYILGNPNAPIRLVDYSDFL